MTERQLSIALVARDAASGVVAGVGRSLGVLSTTARAATVSMGAIGAATVVANQGLELLKKGAELARGAYELFIARALESRDATDPGRAALTQFADAASRLQIAIGNVLMPTLVGLAEAFRPLLDAAAQWLETNREIVGVQIAEWVVRAGQATLSVLVPAAQLAATVWMGVKSVFLGVEAVVNSAFGVIADGVADVTRMGAALAAATPGGGALAKTLGEVSQAATGVGREFRISSAAAQRAILDDEARMREFRGEIGAIGEDARRILASVIPAAAKSAAAGIKIARDAASGAGEGEGMMDAIVREARPYLDQLRREREDVERQARMDVAETAREMEAAAQQWAQRRLQESRERNAAELAAQQQLLAQQRAGEQAVAGALVGAVGAARAAINAGREAGDAAIAVLDSLANSVLNQIVNSLAKMAVKGLFSMIPGVGGFLGGFLGFARGGLVPETIGVPGQDSVPALLMPGELVVPRDQVRAARTAGAGLTAGGGGGGNITIHVDARSTVPDSRADLDRRMRPVAVAARRVERATGSR